VEQLSREHRRDSEPAHKTCEASDARRASDNQGRGKEVQKSEFRESGR